MTMVLAVDIGTTSAKAAVVDDGTIIEVAEAPVDLAHPQPGWAEQDPAQWWTSLVAAVLWLGFYFLHRADIFSFRAMVGS